MRRASRSTACFVMVAIAGMVGAACGSAGGDPKGEGATSTTTIAEEVSLPKFGPFDTGTMHDIAVDPHASAASGGATKIRLRTCEHVAPGRWLLRGDVSEPADPPVTVVFEADFARGDQGTGVGVRATVTGQGPFTVPIDLFARDETKKVGLWAMEADTCSLDLRDGDGDFADVTASSVPIDYDAPAGSVQALGIGARMDRRDAAFAWAYFVWSHQLSPFAELWIPPPGSQQFRLSDPSDPDAPDCLAFQYAIGETLVEQSAGCARLRGSAMIRSPTPTAFAGRTAIPTDATELRS